MKLKCLVSWSSGKDAAFALFKISQDTQYEVCGLFTTLRENDSKVNFHETPLPQIEAQAHTLNLPLHTVFLPERCPNTTYEERLGKFLEEQKTKGVTHLVFGDLFLEDIRKYREKLCSNLHLTPLFPLWTKDTHKLALEMIQSGMKARITYVDEKILPSPMIGRTFDREFLQELPKEVDPCGENGEFHTYVEVFPTRRSNAKS